MIRITKQERDWLVKNGVKLGDNGISHTVARHRRTYYLTESKKNMEIYNRYLNQNKKLEVSEVV